MSFSTMHFPQSINTDITEDDEASNGSSSSNGESGGEDSVDFSLKKGLGMIGRGLTSTTKRLMFHRKSKK